MTNHRRWIEKILERASRGDPTLSYAAVQFAKQAQREAGGTDDKADNAQAFDDEPELVA